MSVTCNHMVKHLIEPCHLKVPQEESRFDVSLCLHVSGGRGAGRSWGRARVGPDVRESQGLGSQTPLRGGFLCP